MDVKEVEVLQRYLKRHKVILYVIVGFLALLTYLLVVVAGQVSREQAFQGQSKAFDGGLTTNYGEDDQGEGQFGNSGATMDGDTTSPRSCIAKLEYGNPDPGPGNGQCAIYSNPKKYSELCFSCPGEPENSCNHTVSASEIKSTNDSGICRIDPYTRQRVCYKSCATLEELQAKANEKCQGMRACPRDADPIVPGAGADPSPIPSPTPTTAPIGPSPTPGACKAKLEYGNENPGPGNGQCAIYSNPRRYAELCFSCPGEPENSCNHTVSASEIKSTDESGRCYIDQRTRKKVCYKQCATFEELQARADEKCRSMRACPR